MAKIRLKYDPKYCGNKTKMRLKFVESKTNDGTTAEHNALAIELVWNTTSPAKKLVNYKYPWDALSVILCFQKGS